MVISAMLPSSVKYLFSAILDLHFPLLLPTWSSCALVVVYVRSSVFAFFLRSLSMKTDDSAQITRMMKKGLGPSAYFSPTPCLLYKAFFLSVLSLASSSTWPHVWLLLVWPVFRLICCSLQSACRTRLPLFHGVSLMWESCFLHFSSFSCREA